MNLLPDISLSLRDKLEDYTPDFVVFIVLSVFITMVMGKFGLLIAIIYLIGGFTIIKEDEKGVKVLLGKPRFFLDSGPQWRWLFLEKIVIFTKNQNRADFESRDVITVPGKYKPKNSDASEEDVGRASIGVNSAIYWFWPDGDDLIDTVKFAPTNKPEVMNNHIEQSVVDAVRKVAGRHNWMTLVEDRVTFAEEVLEAIKPTDPERLAANPTPFVKAKLKDVDVNITDIILPEDLSSSINLPEKARFQKEAEIKAGEAEKIKLTLVGEGEKSKRTSIGEGDAAARGAMIEKVLKGGIDLEALFTLRELAQGTSNTILYQVPNALSERISQMFGGTPIEDLFKKLTPEMQTEAVKMINSQISKIQKK